MKYILSVLLIIVSFVFSSCTDDAVSVGIIGGADGPTSIYVKGRFGEQYEKKPVRMFNIDGELYFDSGLISDTALRCGTLDGNLKKTVKENEIPHKSGEANFDADGYQYATSITKEVNINGKWVIFKKYDTYGKELDAFKYCYYIKGHLNNAAKDSEIIVLSEDNDITFSDVYEPLLSSQSTVGADIGKVIHNSINTDKWGLALFPENVTKKGMTIKFEQFGGNAKGKLQTDEWFLLEKLEDSEWKKLEVNPLINYVWHTVAYGIERNDITKLQVEWKWLYGELSPGYYRLSKEVMDFKKPGDFEKEIYQVYFTVE